MIMLWANKGWAIFSNSPAYRVRDYMFGTPFFKGAGYFEFFPCGTAGTVFKIRLTPFL
jgi:hypothetical protein